MPVDIIGSNEPDMVAVLISKTRFNLLWEVIKQLPGERDLKENLAGVATAAMTGWLAEVCLWSGYFGLVQ